MPTAAHVSAPLNPGLHARERVKPVKWADTRSRHVDVSGKITAPGLLAVLMAVVGGFSEICGNASRYGCVAGRVRSALTSGAR